MRVVFVPVLLLLATASGVYGQNSVKDPFNGLNRNLWVPSNTAAKGSSVMVSQGTLRLTMATGTGPDLGVGLKGGYVVSGDFDLQVDFNLLLWPKEQQRLGITISSAKAGVTVERTHDPIPNYGDCYLVSGITNTTLVRTSDNAGKLRLVRANSNYYGYYWKQNGWVQIASVGGPTGPVIVYLELWVSPWQTTQSAVRVALDNFAATGNPITPLLSGVGTPRVGQTVTLNLAPRFDVGLPYQIASSLGTGPIQVGHDELGLSPDNLLVVSVNNSWPSIFAAYRGTIGQNGQATAKINIPNIQALIGQTIHTAFVTIGSTSPFGIESISNTYSFTIVK